MASFFNVGALGGNPFSTPVGQRIEQATDSSLTTENWALNMEICDMINESSDTARDAMKAIRKRLNQNAGKNNQTILYTLTVLETCVKNCGKAFHVLVASKDFIQELVKLIGPKNGPPAAVQDKVLSLIQIWADAFKNQPDLNGVTQMYTELKSKGIDFPSTDPETMAPIYTPQRSVPEIQMPSQLVAHPATSPLHGFPLAAAAAMPNNGVMALTPEQTAKLHSELEVVGFNMSVLNDMLNELKPGQEGPEDYTLLQELTSTCKEMQSRIVDLIGRIQDDELTAELLRLNDELNSLFLRQQRFEKNRGSSSTTSPSAILGAAIGVPKGGAAGALDSSCSPPKLPSAMQPKLIDLMDKTESSFGKMSIGGETQSAAAASTKDADEFDILAQSRSDSIGKSELLKDIPSMDILAGSMPPAPAANADVGKLPSKDSDFDEMEAWLRNSKEAVGVETLTSTEFDKFLEERAAAAENLPSVSADNQRKPLMPTAAASATTNATNAGKQKPEDEDLLKL